MRNRILNTLFVVSLTVMSSAFVALLFKLPGSQVIVKGRWFVTVGVVAWLIILFWGLEIAHRQKAQLSLTGAQTLDLIHLFQETCKYEFLRHMFGWIDELEVGEKIPSLKERHRILDRIRHEPRTHVTSFLTPFPDLNKHMEGKVDLPVYKETIVEAMRIVESSQPPHLKRKHLWELADSAKDAIYHTYVHDLRKLNAV